MKYEFHVGDYVETKGGHIGYISQIKTVSSGYTMLYICYTDGKNYPCDASDDYVEARFNRIGQYDFTKSEQLKEIKKLRPYSWNIDTSGDVLIYKINELVDVVNELRKEHT